MNIVWNTGHTRKEEATIKSNCHIDDCKVFQWTVAILCHHHHDYCHYFLKQWSGCSSNCKLSKQAFMLFLYVNRITFNFIKARNWVHFYNDAKQCQTSSLAEWRIILCSTENSMQPLNQSEKEQNAARERYILWGHFSPLLPLLTLQRAFLSDSLNFWKLSFMQHLFVP